MKARLIDLAERSFATFWQAFGALLIADSTGITQVSALKVAAVAGGLAVVKYLSLQAGNFLKTPPAA